MVRRAALVQDIGMTGIPSTVWDEAGEWSIPQRERAWTHPYLTARMLARTPMLAPVGRCAALHHERLDGSGYPNGLRADAISPAARILGAADVYNALRQPRPHRRPLMPVRPSGRCARRYAPGGSMATRSRRCLRPPATGPGAGPACRPG
jgi:HD-GYP domain-containing protein (c-di-GMP phosphodiesterase class II)